MIRFRRRAAALVGTAALTAAMVGVTPATSSAAPMALAAQGTPFAQARFAAYGTGSELVLSALKSGPTQLARVDQAFSGNTAASGGLGAAVSSPITGGLVQPAIGGVVNATARGSGLEVGTGLSAGQANQIQLGIAESHAPPPNHVGSLAGPDVSAVPLTVPGLLTTGVLHGFAATSYNGIFCPVGAPIAYGLGSAAAPTTVLNTVVASPGAAQSSTRTDLVANPDGTFGLANTVREAIAPLLVTLVGGATPTTLEISVQGTSVSTPVSLTAHTDGEGNTTMTLANADPSVTVRLTLAGVALPPITASLAALAPLLNGLIGPGSALNTLLAAAGLNLSVTLGDGRTVASPIPGFANSANTISGSYDLLALHLGLGATTLADLRLGHMEAAVTLPSGPISCTIPVAKNANPAVVQAGSSFVWSISVPSSAAALNDSTCDLTHIRLVDKISVNSGSPTFTIGAISNGGVYDAGTQTVTWANLGNYHPGDPPIVVTITVSTPPNSAAGVLQDTATASAGLGNCTGGATGVATAIGNVGNVVLTGAITLVAPRVTTGAGGPPGLLATTGTGPMLPWMAAGLLMVAEATRRLLRRAKQPAQLG